MKWVEQEQDMSLEITQLKDTWMEFYGLVEKLKADGYTVVLQHNILDCPEMNYNPLELELRISKTEVY